MCVSAPRRAMMCPSPAPLVVTRLPAGGGGGGTVAKQKVVEVVPKHLKADVAIIGGGVIGCLTAYYATLRGLKPVIIESDGIASGASGMAAGILTPYTGSGASELLALSKASLKLHVDLVKTLPAETGVDYGYDSRPHLRCVFTEDGAVRLKAWQKARAKEGFKSEWLSPLQAKSLSAWLTGDILGALLSEIEPTVDAYRFTLAAFTAAERRGAKLVIGRASGLLSKGKSKAAGVRLVDGSEISAPETVIATGPWAGEAGAWLGYPVPVKPQKGQMLYLDLAHGGQPKPQVSLGGFDTGGILLPKKLTETIVGATREDAGFDRAPTDAARKDLITKVSRFSGRIMDASIVRQTACLRPMPADGKPYIGRAPGWDGVWLGIGHWSEGIHFGPLTGRYIADMVVDDKSKYDLSAVASSRISA
ncbi:MAG: FAD-binding oxidoreductase [Dehalococcoidia bacterium]|nr:FAD-binding oxidoreductase [Dehalococcoidia bacterium]MSQ35431.1 FAD-binding oxidoreductase [Dehalococcoidia bacterium]